MKRSNRGITFLSIIGIIIVLLLIANLFTPQLKMLIYPLIHNEIVPQKIQQMFITPTPVDMVKMKKDSLAQFYTGMVQAELDKDYEKQYEYNKPYLGTWVTKDEFIAYQKSWLDKKNIISHEMVIHDIKIDGNIGTIDRTRTFCYSKTCTGADREEDHQLKLFEYIDGKWSMPKDKQPSERALKAASYTVMAVNKNERHGKTSFGVKKDDVAIHFFAVALDSNLQKLITVEILIEKAKAEASRPIYNYQPPDINIEAPAVQQAPVNNSIRCTTNTIGSYTYTNCY